jgi:hypothetical protein
MLDIRYIVYLQIFKDDGYIDSIDISDEDKCNWILYNHSHDGRERRDDTYSFNLVKLYPCPYGEHVVLLSD